MELIGEFPLRRIKPMPNQVGGRHARCVHVLSGPPSGSTGEETAVSPLRVRQRAERGMSVSALARRIGVPQSNLSEMLSGKRGWSKSAIRGLSTHLNIRAERFLA